MQLICRKLFFTKEDINFLIHSMGRECNALFSLKNASFYRLQLIGVHLEWAKERGEHGGREWFIKIIIIIEDVYSKTWHISREVDGWMCIPRTCAHLTSTCSNFHFLNWNLLRNFSLSKFTREGSFGFYMIISACWSVISLLQHKWRSKSDNDFKLHKKKLENSDFHLYCIRVRN